MYAYLVIKTWTVSDGEGCPQVNIVHFIFSSEDKARMFARKNIRRMARSYKTSTIVNDGYGLEIETEATKETIEFKIEQYVMR